LANIDYKITPDSVNQNNDGWGVHTVEVWLTLSSYTRDSDGRVLLCSSCVSDKEIDFQAEYLIEQINNARREAKNMMSHMRDKFNLK
jgi:hypothetical protein